MKKILIALLAVIVCLSFCACGSQSSSKPTSEKSYLSLQELVSDPGFQEAIAADESENDMFKTSVSASSDSVLVYEATAKKTYDKEDVDYLSNRTSEDISDKFGLAELQKLLKQYGFGNVTIDFKMYNGDGTLITERTYEPK